MGGQGERGVVLWDTWIPPDEKRTLKPFAELAEMSKSMASVVAFNPRMNLFATAHKDVVCFYKFLFPSQEPMDITTRLGETSGDPE